MKGIEIAEKYFYEVGLPVFRSEFPEIFPKLAFGLTGSGSECFGFDDDVSRDHDFEPGFIVFLPGEDEVSRSDEFALCRAYASLPSEFCGLHRADVSAVGGKRHGVLRISDFYKDKVGAGDGVLTIDDWLSLPEFALAEAVNGRIFLDNFGLVSEIRRGLSKYPADVKLKKLAGYLLLMHQAGAYNFERCLAHEEESAAQLAIFEYVTSCMHVIFLLNDKYMPYYKWSFRALRALPVLGELADSLDYLMTSGNSQGQREVKAGVIEDIRIRITEEVVRGGGIVSKSRTPGVGLSAGTFASAKVGTGLDPEAVAAGASSSVHAGTGLDSEAVKAGVSASVHVGTGLDPEAVKTVASTYGSLHQLAYAVNDSIRDGHLRNQNILAGVE